MLKEKSVELTDEQLGKLVRRLPGPPEEWDDSAAQFVLKVYGIDIRLRGRSVYEEDAQ